MSGVIVTPVRHCKLALWRRRMPRAGNRDAPAFSSGEMLWCVHAGVAVQSACRVAAKPPVKLNQLIKRERRRDWIPRQATEPVITVSSKLANLFARFDSQLSRRRFRPAAPQGWVFWQSAHLNRDVPPELSLHRPAVGVDKCGAWLTGIVRNNAQIDHFAAKLLQHQMHS